MQIRINKFLSQLGIGSRRKIEKMLWDGEFKVNGAKAVPGQMLESTSDIITHKDKPIKGTEKLIYYLLNKPADYVSTVSDEFKRKTVLDLVPKAAAIESPTGSRDFVERCEWADEARAAISAAQGAQPVDVASWIAGRDAAADECERLRESYRRSADFYDEGDPQHRVAKYSGAAAAVCAENIRALTPPEAQPAPEEQQ